MLDHNTPRLSSTDADCFEMDTPTAKWFDDLIGDYAHEVKGRIMSLQLSIYLLEQQSLNADMQRVIERMKADINILTHGVEHLREDAHPCGN